MGSATHKEIFKSLTGLGYMKHVYILLCIVYATIFVNSRGNGCAIPDDQADTVVIVGIGDDFNEVEEYNSNGPLRTLPNLVQGRYGLACAAYRDNNGDIVS